MTAIYIAHRLPFVTVTVRAKGQFIIVNHVLLDTGSGGTAFKTDDMEKIGILLQPEDRIIRMRGVGGTDPVVQKQVDAVEVGDLVVAPMTIQVGGLEYGFPMDGILGLDFLLQTGAQINFSTLEIGKV